MPIGRYTATIEEFAKDGYTHIESSCPRCRVIRLRPIEWLPRISMGLTIAQLSERLRCADCGSSWKLRTAHSGLLFWKQVIFQTFRHPARLAERRARVLQKTRKPGRRLLLAGLLFWKHANRRLPVRKLSRQGFKPSVDVAPNLIFS
jgi:hypothetical protein